MSVARIVPHELERAEEEGEEQIAEQEQERLLEEEQRTRRVEFGRPRTPEPTGLGITHLTTTPTVTATKTSASVHD